MIISIRLAQKINDKKKEIERERAATAYPRSAVMSFGYICVNERERENA
jgi:hypothetical protein